MPPIAGKPSDGPRRPARTAQPEDRGGPPRRCAPWPGPRRTAALALTSRPLPLHQVRAHAHLRSVVEGDLHVRGDVELALLNRNRGGGTTSDGRGGGLTDDRWAGGRFGHVGD